MKMRRLLDSLSYTYNVEKTFVPAQEKFDGWTSKKMHN